MFSPNLSKVISPGPPSCRTPRSCWLMGLGGTVTSWPLPTGPAISCQQLWLLLC